jgi:hypothetical protein
VFSRWPAAPQRGSDVQLPRTAPRTPARKQHRGTERPLQSQFPPHYEGIEDRHHELSPAFILMAEALLSTRPAQPPGWDTDGRRPTTPWAG